MISRQYMAGFFDGEGCVSLTVSGKAKRVALRVMIVNTDPEILQEINLEFGGRLSSPVIHQDGWKAFRSLVFRGKEAYEFLLAISPYVIVKKRQIRLAMEFWSFQQRPKTERCNVVYSQHARFRGLRSHMVTKPSVIAKENAFKTQMHELNKKGLVQ